MLVVKNLPASSGDIRKVGSVLGLEDPLEEDGNPLQYSCLKNPMDRGAWRATVHSVAQSQIQLKRLSTHSHISLEGKGQGREVEGRRVGKREKRSPIDYTQWQILDPPPTETRSLVFLPSTFELVLVIFLINI